MNEKIDEGQARLGSKMIHFGHCPIAFKANGQVSDSSFSAWFVSDHLQAMNSLLLAVYF